MLNEALDSLGMKIGPGQQPDAIHLAVMPAEAAHEMLPGEPVGLEEGKASLSAKHIGIVDPFLTDPVQEGEHFWLVINPRTITSLRHVWTHPDIESDEAEDQKARSEQWLRNFINGADCPGYERVMGEVLDPSGWEPELYMHFNGLDAHGEIPDEFWKHAEIVTGQQITIRPKYFSCAC